MNPTETLDAVVSDSEAHTKRMVSIGLAIMYDRMIQDRIPNIMRVENYIILLDIGKQVGMDVSVQEDNLRDYLGLMPKVRR